MTKVSSSWSVNGSRFGLSWRDLGVMGTSRNSSPSGIEGTSAILDKQKSSFGSMPLLLGDQFCMLKAMKILLLAWGRGMLVKARFVQVRSSVDLEVSFRDIYQRRYFVKSCIFAGQTTRDPVL
jgi:hypothetical protein